MTQKTVVILLSDKRSGSTMFQRELCKHPQIQTVAYSPHAYLETHHWLKGAVLLNMAPQTFAGGKIYAGYGSRSNARTYIVDCIKQNVPEFQIPLDDRALVFDGWEALCEKYAQPVFFEKSPQLLAHWSGLSLLLDWIRQTKFKVQIIGMTRNPLSVLYSAFQLFHTDPARREYAWLESRRNMLAFRSLLPDNMFWQVKYEDIIQTPQASFAAVCDFIGVARSPELGVEVYAESLTKWKKDPYFTFRLDPVVKQMAIQFGYSEEELENPIKPDPPLTYLVQKGWQKVVNLTIARMSDRVLKPILLRLKWESRR